MWFASRAGSLPLPLRYGKQVEDTIRTNVNHITKLEFLPAFKTAFNAALTSQNIKSGFQATGLVPFDPDVILTKLDIQLQTPRPSSPDMIAWDSQTPHNSTELTF